MLRLCVPVVARLTMVTVTKKRTRQQERIEMAMTTRVKSGMAVPFIICFRGGLPEWKKRVVMSLQEHARATTMIHITQSTVLGEAMHEPS